jgi:hypothetical protein
MIIIAIILLLIGGFILYSGLYPYIKMLQIGIAFYALFQPWTLILIGLVCLGIGIIIVLAKKDKRKDKQANGSNFKYFK